MKKSVRWFVVALLAAVSVGRADPSADPIGASLENYFAEAFAGLKAVADQKPTVENFRDAMKPLAESTDGFFGGTLIDTEFVIREVYYKRDFLARGFDLKKVKQLDYFWDLMRKAPAPQLSEPGHGNIMQPRLIAMRYPVLANGRLEAVVSMMVRTEAFLKATGLDRCRAYRITCRGALAEEEGDLQGDLKTVKLSLPSTEWRIDYKP